LKINGLGRESHAHPAIKSLDEERNDSVGESAVPDFRQGIDIE